MTENKKLTSCFVTMARVIPVDISVGKKPGVILASMLDIS